MRRLWLLRHGEAEPGTPEQDDAQRHLTALGRKHCLEVAQLLKSRTLRPDLIMASSAQRTLETAEIVASQLRFTSPLSCERALYLATPTCLLQALQGCDASAVGVLLIGHNPGLSEFAQQLAASTQPIELRTAGLCQFDLTIDHWGDLQPNSQGVFSLLR